jgi:L-ascorbate metabolism protein UlaG (beta-lactamase superfamily)
MTRAGITRLDAVAPVHTQFDHALDAPLVAAQTGAVLAGGASTANLGRGCGLAEDRLVVVTPGEPVRFGTFRLAWVLSQHCPPDRYPGPITTPVVPPARAGAYRCGETWSVLAEHDRGRTALIQGSAGFVAGALAGHRVASRRQDEIDLPLSECERECLPRPRDAPATSAVRPASSRTGLLPTPDPTGR